MDRDHSQSKLEYLLSDPSFRDWIFLNKDAEKWEFWTLEDKQRAKLVDEARLILQSLKTDNARYTENDLDIALLKTWDKIILINKQYDSKTYIKKFIYAAAAVTILFSIIFSKFIIQKNINSNQYHGISFQNQEGLIEQINNSNKALLITLSDGSSVLLQPKSKLSYPKTFASNERKVFLTGEAFFEVSKDPNKNFIVISNELITRVFGTSFRVVAYNEQPNVEVLVRTGKVSVSSSKMKGVHNELLLLPNQAARYTKENLLLEKIEDITQSDALTSKPSSIEMLSFEFNDIAVHQIFNTLEKAYLVQIDYPTEALKNCYLTTSLNDLTLSEKMKIICESIGNNTSYSINGNQIRIYSNGCD